MKTGTEFPCTGCGRVVAYRTARQYVGGVDGRGGGKHRVPHNCPHGIPCVFGEKYGGNGWNGPAVAGRNHCAVCFAARRRSA